MADITARLIWYRISELCNSTGIRLPSLDLSQFDLLDLIFVSWCLLSVLAIVAVNIVTSWLQRDTADAEASRTLGPPDYRPAHNGPPLLSIPEEEEAAAVEQKPQADPESCAWLNSFAAWLFKNSQGSAPLLQAWLSALNTALVREKRTLLFEEILVGDRPPVIVSVRGRQRTDAGEESDSAGGHNSIMELLLDVRSTEVALRVRDTNGCVETFEVVLKDIEAEVLAEFRLCHDGFKGFLRLASRPRLRSEVRQYSGASASASPSTLSPPPNVQWIAEEVTAAVTQAVTEVFLTDGEQSPLNRLSGFHPVQPAAVERRDAWCQTEHETPLPHSMSSPPKPPAPIFRENSKAPEQQQLPLTKLEKVRETPTSVRLLVKLIKATGLAPRSLPGMPGFRTPQNPYACVELDEPYQRHVTKSSSASCNPFWDEHCLLDLTPQSTRLSIHVFDLSGQSHALLGSASLLLSDIPAQGARVLQPLRPPNAGKWSPASASSDESDDAEPASRVRSEQVLTAEFLFVSPPGAEETQIPREKKSASTDVILGTAEQKAEEPQLAKTATKIPGENTSLTRTVDEFMKTSDISYQPMSSTDCASGCNPPSPVPEISGPPADVDALTLRSGSTAADSTTLPSGRDAAFEYPASSLRTSVGQSYQYRSPYPDDYAQSMPVLNMIPTSEDEGGHKPKSKKPRSSSFASKFRRVFGGGSDKKKMKQQKQQQQQQQMMMASGDQDLTLDEQPFTSPITDQVFLSDSPSLDRRQSNQQAGTSGIGNFQDATLTPSDHSPSVQDESAAAAGHRGGDMKRKRGSFSSSLRRLFRGKKKHRQRTESGPISAAQLTPRPLYLRPDPRQQTVSGGGTSAPSSRRGGWNSEEIL